MATGERAHSPARLQRYSTEFLTECLAIADWWLHHGLDPQNGGFWGEVSHDNVPNPTAPKSVILNTRILWFFSELAQERSEPAIAAAAHRAFQYLVDYFVDPDHGGVFWNLTAAGEVVDGRKHTYAQAFAIYAFSAYYRFSDEPKALSLALECFDLLEQHAKDPFHNGYFEAFSRNWGPAVDIRLSEKEDAFPKTMNTHLHLLEAYSGLFQALPFQHLRSAEVFAALENILEVYCERVVDVESGHVRMFMSAQWEDHSHAYSFGHDIESSWLIEKAIELLRLRNPTAARFYVQVKRLAEVALRDGLLPSGAMADECDKGSGRRSHSAWWVQAEAMVGFTSLWAQGEGSHYLEAALGIWRHVQHAYVDSRNGEWFWYSRFDVPPEASEYKIGAWKAPYHNGRAMLLMHRLLA